MKRLTLIIAGLSAIAASPATAQSNSRYPHRDWGKVATLNMSVIDATTCILRVLNRGSTATLIPAEGGNDIDLKPGTILGTGAGDVHGRHSRLEAKTEKQPCAFSIATPSELAQTTRR
jgi:hypothetical protein